MGESVWAPLGMLVAVVAILALAYGTTRLIASRGMPSLPGGGRDRRFQVLGQWNVGRNERLLLLLLGERCLLLGVTASSVTLLLELTEEEARPWRETLEQRQNVGAPSFLEVLQKNLRGKK